MHKYLRAVGFSMYQTRRDIHELLRMLESESTSEKSIQETADTDFCEIRTEVADAIGISLVGSHDDDGTFLRDFYFPYLEGHEISTKMECSVQRHAERETCIGMVDEPKIGISLIFYVRNFMEYWERKQKRGTNYRIASISLSALSVSGKILLPIQKTKKQIQQAKVAAKNRTSLIEAAKNGDEEAMESLTIEDIDLYSQISRRAMREDLYSIIDSCFMPCGFECDQYSIIGEILQVEKLKNRFTNEEIYRMRINCSDLLFDVCINAHDLYGEPAVGRRFKGQIWLQGTLNFE